MIVTVTLNPALDRTLTTPRIVFNEMTRGVARLDWGGKGFNVSRALHALGVESVALGLVGGATGRLLADGLRSLGIAADLTPIAGETRTNTIIIEAETGRYIKVNEPGPLVTPAELDGFLDQARTRARPGDLWVLSGSLPPGAPSDFYARLIAVVQENGARACLDASGEALRLGCAARPYLVKPNAIEAGEMTGREIHSEADVQASAVFFLQQGIEVTALSLGADGLLLATKEQVVRARPPAIQARNPVGAGDALLAGLVWALERGCALEEAARWGVATGTAAAAREGVSVGGRAEVERLYAQVEMGYVPSPPLTVSSNCR